MARLAVFDCDGTLIDGQASICDAMETAFAAFALPAPGRNAIRRAVGLSLPQAVRVLGWQLAVAPGMSARGLAHCLASHGLHDPFVSLQTADRHPSKPHPAMLEAALREADVEPAQAVMIGDTAYDMAMAGHAGVRGIGVDWGYHAPEELRAAGAEYVATRPAGLRDYLLR